VTITLPTPFGQKGAPVAAAAVEEEEEEAVVVVVGDDQEEEAAGSQAVATGESERGLIKDRAVRQPGVYILLSAICVCVCVSVCRHQKSKKTIRLKFVQQTIVIVSPFSFCLFKYLFLFFFLIFFLVPRPHVRWLKYRNIVNYPHI